jgi:hypothetical protein
VYFNTKVFETGVSIKKSNGVAHAGVSVVTPPTPPSSLKIITIA